jgi:hypothetical protein
VFPKVATSEDHIVRVLPKVGLCALQCLFRVVILNGSVFYGSAIMLVQLPFMACERTMVARLRWPPLGSGIVSNTLV